MTTIITVRAEMSAEAIESIHADLGGPPGATEAQRDEMVARLAGVEKLIADLEGLPRDAVRG